MTAPSLQLSAVRRGRTIHRSARIGLVAAAAGLFAAVQPALANQHDGDHPAGMTDAAMPMPGMGAMMRPDMAPPLGVTGAMGPRRGTIMPSLRFMHMRMDGNRDGTDDVGTAEVLSQFPVAPLRMEVDALMAGVMYGVTDDISVMAMIPYFWRSMDLVTGTNVGFTTRSEGIGDARVIGGFDVYEGGGQSISASLGFGVPTGSTDERDDTPAGNDQLLPYPMQNGSGTFDLLPGFAYTGRSDDWSWGGQANAVIRLGENGDDYTLGNTYGATVWGARRWTDWLSASVRLAGEVVEDIDGADPRLNPLQVPTADPDLRAGNFLSLGLGLNFVVPSGPAAGARLSVEGIVPIVQDLDGPQLKRDYMILIGLRQAF